MFRVALVLLVLGIATYHGTAVAATPLAEDAAIVDASTEVQGAATDTIETIAVDAAAPNLVQRVIATLNLSVVYSPLDHTDLGIYGVACDPSYRAYPGNVQDLVCGGMGPRTVVVFANGMPYADWILANEVGHFLHPGNLHEGSAWEFACSVAYNPAYCSSRPAWAHN